jgi:NAD-dependent dihydropyrimidine dehydrogenase PreA subunit
MAKSGAYAAARAWQRLQLPALDERRCTGCGRCVAICPTDCLAMDGRLPWLPRPLDCIRCSACAIVCPTSAIVVPLPAG